MSDRRSSSRARRDRFPWLLAAGPAIVVVASLATMVLAITHDDGVVARDYYKLGLTVNRRIAAAPPPVADGTATLSISGAGEVRVRLDGIAPAPASLAITLHRPGAPADTPVALAARPGGEWTASVGELPPGRRIVTLQAAGWRIPVALVDGVPATLRLPAAYAGS